MYYTYILTKNIEKGRKEGNFGERQCRHTFRYIDTHICTFTHLNFKYVSCQSTQLESSSHITYWDTTQTWKLQVQVKLGRIHMK